MRIEVIFIFLARIAQAALNVVALRVLTAYLSPAEAGGYYLILSIAAGFGGFLISPGQMYIARKLHSWAHERKVIQHLSAFNFYIFGVSLFAFGVIYLLKSVVDFGAGFSPLSLALVVGGYVYASNWNMTNLPALNMLGYRKSFAVISASTFLFALLFSFLFIHLFFPAAHIWAAGQILAFVIAGTAAFFTISGLTGEPSHLGVVSALPKVKSYSGLYSFAAPLTAGALFMWLQNYSYRLIVEKIAGAELLGYLGVGMGISVSLASITESLIQQVYFPDFYKNLHGADKRARAIAWNKLAVKSVPIYLAATAFAIVAAPQLTRILVAKSFSGVSVYIALGAVVEMLRMTSNIVSVGAQSEMKTDILVKPYLWGGIAAVILVYISSQMPRREILIPLSLVVSGMVSFWLMRSGVSKIIDVRLYGRTVRNSLLMSLLFLPFLALHKPVSMLAALGGLAAAGAYLVLLIYLIVFKWAEMDENAEPAGGKVL